MVQFLRVKNLAYCEFNRLSAFLPAWEISRERRLCLNVRSTQKCHTEDHQSSWPDSGKLLRHQYGISVVESCETSQAARRREGCIRRLHSFRALRLNRTENLLSFRVYRKLITWSNHAIPVSLFLSRKTKKLRNWKRVCLLSNTAWLMAHSFENVYNFIPVSESKGGEKRLAEAVFK